MAKKALTDRVNTVAPMLMETIRRRVAFKLAIIGKSRAVLCKEHGVPASSMSNYLNNDNMTIRSLVLIAEMLGVSPAWLMSPMDEESEGE